MPQRVARSPRRLGACLGAPTEHGHGDIARAVGAGATTDEHRADRAPVGAQKQRSECRIAEIPGVGVLSATAAVPRWATRRLSRDANLPPGWVSCPVTPMQMLGISKRGAPPHPIHRGIRQRTGGGAAAGTLRNRAHHRARSLVDRLVRCARRPEQVFAKPLDSASRATGAIGGFHQGQHPEAGYCNLPSDHYIGLDIGRHINQDEKADGSKGRR